MNSKLTELKRLSNQVLGTDLGLNNNKDAFSGLGMSNNFSSLGLTG